jgi:hypothetical protein
MVLEVQTAGGRRPTTALSILARIVWNARSIVREPAVGIGRAALADPVTREARVVPAFLTIPG